MQVQEARCKQTPFKQCRVDKCMYRVEQGELYVNVKHVAKTKDKQCSREGSTNEVVSGGVCMSMRHGAQVKQTSFSQTKHPGVQIDNNHNKSRLSPHPPWPTKIALAIIMLVSPLLPTKPKPTLYSTATQAGYVATAPPSPTTTEDQTMLGWVFGWVCINRPRITLWRRI